MSVVKHHLPGQGRVWAVPLPQWAGGKRGDVRSMPFVITVIMLHHSGLKSLPRGAH